MLIYGISGARDLDVSSGEGRGEGFYIRLWCDGERMRSDRTSFLFGRLRCFVDFRSWFVHLAGAETVTVQSMCVVRGAVTRVDSDLSGRGLDSGIVWRCDWSSVIGTSVVVAVRQPGSSSAGRILWCSCCCYMCETGKRIFFPSKTKYQLLRWKLHLYFLVI